LQQGARARLSKDVFDDHLVHEHDGEKPCDNTQLTCSPDHNKFHDAEQRNDVGQEGPKHSKNCPRSLGRNNALQLFGDAAPRDITGEMNPVRARMVVDTFE